MPSFRDRINLSTYRCAVFGEHCEQHFRKLHRLCELRTLAEELLGELCEQLFTNIRLKDMKKKTEQRNTMSIN